MCHISILEAAGCAIVVGLVPLFGQGITLSGTGYTDPSIVRVAPGQITTLFVAGLKTVLSKPVNATTVPLPMTLAGISVKLNQGGSQPTPVPLLSIQHLSVCGSDGTSSSASGMTADCPITAMTVQIPFELTGPDIGPPPTVPISASPPALVVSENGNVSKAFPVSPVPDNLHVINICDGFPPVKAVSASGYCGPLVTHADGTLVTIKNPAQPDEEVVIWAFGLGQTSPAAKTRQTSPSPAAPLSSLLYLQFDFRINAVPSPPFISRTAAIPPPTPTFAGLTPGQVGLYQINVIVPSSIPAVNSCLPICSHVACTIYNTVQSNLTINHDQYWCELKLGRGGDLRSAPTMKLAGFGAPCS
jgi:uncharacterized protein (TIGR03437 family)